MVVPNPKKGVSVIVVDEEGAIKSYFHGPKNAVKFTTQPRTTQDGSAEWLNQVYVSQSAAKLRELQSSFPPNDKTPVGTSGSSLKVTLCTDLIDTKSSDHVLLKDAWVIAVGEEHTDTDGTTSYWAHTLIASPKEFSEGSQWHALWVSTIEFIKREFEKANRRKAKGAGAAY